MRTFKRHAFLDSEPKLWQFTRPGCLAFFRPLFFWTAFFPIGVSDTFIIPPPYCPDIQDFFEMHLPAAVKLRNAPAAIAKLDSGREEHFENVLDGRAARRRADLSLAQRKDGREEGKMGRTVEERKGDGIDQGRRAERRAAGRRAERLNGGLKGARKQGGCRESQMGGRKEGRKD